MSNEQTPSGVPVNQASVSGPRPAPGMDIVPPAVVPAPVQPEPQVVAAPPEEHEVLQISDEIAEQIAADSTAPPLPMHNPVVSEPAHSSGVSAMAPQPGEEDTLAPDAGDSPNELIQAELHRSVATPVAAVVKTPKAANPAQGAVIATIVITLLLAGLAIFAYMSTQQQ